MVRWIKFVFLIVESGKKFLRFQNYKHPQLKICKLTSFYLGLVTIVAIFANNWVLTDVVVVLIKCLLFGKMIKIVFLIAESGKKFSVFKRIHTLQLKICKLTSFTKVLWHLSAIFANNWVIAEVVVALIKWLLCCKIIKIVFLIVEGGKICSVFKIINIHS